MLLSSDLNGFIPRFGLANLATENSHDLFPYNDDKAGCEAGLLTKSVSLSGSVTFTCGGHGRTICKAMIMKTGSVVNSKGQQSLFKRDLCSSGHSSRRLYTELLEITSLRIYYFEVVRSQISSTASADQLPLLVFITSGLCRGGRP